MKLLHAAALALTGWYLLGPPLYDPPGFVERLLGATQLSGYDYQAPIWKWQKIEEYDRVADCHAKIDEALEDSVRRAAKNVDEDWNTWVGQWRCVATDDPSLKAN